MKKDSGESFAKNAALVGGSAIAIQGFSDLAYKISGSSFWTVSLVMLNLGMLVVHAQVPDSSLVQLPALLGPIVLAFFFAPAAFLTLVVGYIIVISDEGLNPMYVYAAYCLVAVYDSYATHYFLESKIRNWIICLTQMVCLYAAYHKEMLVNFF